MPDSPHNVPNLWLAQEEPPRVGVGWGGGGGGGGWDPLVTNVFASTFLGSFLETNGCLPWNMLGSP